MRRLGAAGENIAPVGFGDSEVSSIISERIHPGVSATAVQPKSASSCPWLHAKRSTAVLAMS
jgi:hypothetical protein